MTTNYNYIEVLEIAERDHQLWMIQFEKEYQQLRDILVEKYGEHGVCKVEAKIKRERNER